LGARGDGEPEGSATMENTVDEALRIWSGALRAHKKGSSEIRGKLETQRGGGETADTPSTSPVPPPKFNHPKLPNSK